MLVSDGGPEYFYDALIAATLAHGLLDIHLAVRKKTGPQVTVRRQAQAVARGAEMTAHGPDEADLPGGAFEPEAFRRSSSRRRLGKEG